MNYTGFRVVEESLPTTLKAACGAKGPENGEYCTPAASLPPKLAPGAAWRGY